MKKVFISLLLTFCFLITVSQEKYPRGAYLSFIELKNKEPSIPFNFIIKKRNKSEITLSGGNDYFVSASKEKISNKIIKKGIFAISNGDSLFLNCFKYRLQYWYSLVKVDSNLLIFYAGAPMDKNNETIIASGLMFGAIGGAIAGASLANKRYLYVLDINTNKLILLNEKSLKKILSSKPELLKKYEEEDKEYRDYEGIILKYYKTYIEVK